MTQYFLNSNDETKLKNVGINPDYVNAIMEISYNQKYYSNKNNLPLILKEFISIASGKGLLLDIEYGVHNNYAGFNLIINGKGQFIEDFIVEDESQYDKGIEWFTDSLKSTFGV